MERTVLNKAIVPLLLLALIAAAGCAGRQSPPAPEWVYGDASDYPVTGYLIGRGQAGNAADARDRARADLAKNFEVAVVETSVDRSSHASGSDRASASESQQVVRELTTRIERVVRGVEIAEQWQEARNGEHHALAVLPRARAAQALRDEIAALDTATESYLTRARAQEELFSQLRLARQAVLSQRQREQLQRTLQVVDLTGQGVAARWSLVHLQADHDALLERISLRPESSGSHSVPVREMLAAALSQAGFTVSGAAEFTVVARLDIDELTQREGWYWRNGVLEVSLRDRQGNSVGTQRWMLREAATDPKVAQRRVMERAAEVLSRELGDVLLGFAK